MANAQAVRSMMAEVLGESPQALSDDTPLDAVAGGSFTLVELVIAVQEQLHVRFAQSDMQGVETVGDLIALFVERSAKGSA